MESDDIDCVLIVMPISVEPSNAKNDDERER